MARTPGNEKTIQGQQAADAAQQATAYKTGQADVGQYNTNEATLNAGGNVAANPWQNAGYLGNVNRLQAGALNSQANASNNALVQNNRRTGGMNTGATIGAEKGITLQNEQLGDELSAQRAAQDYTKNVGYQQEQAAAPLAAAQAEAPYYSTATQGDSSTLGDMSQYALGQQAYNYSLYNKLLQAAGAGVAGVAGGGGLSGGLSDAAAAV